MSARINCLRSFGETEDCSNYITSISQVLIKDFSVLIFIYGDQIKIHQFLIYYYFLFLEENRRFKKTSISSLQFKFRTAETRNVENRLGEFRRQTHKSCFKRNRIQHCQFLSFKFQGTGIRSFRGITF